MVQIRFVRIWKGKQKMDVVFEDGDQRRMVKFAWFAKERTNVPPAHWYDSALRETKFMDAERKRGGIPGM